MRPIPTVRLLAAAVLAAALVAPSFASVPGTVEEARRFIEVTEQRLLDLWIAAERAAWVQSTYITDDTEKLAAEARGRVIAATLEAASEARRFEGLALPEDVARKMRLLKTSLSLVAPPDPADRKELTEIVASMEGTYSKGRFCPEGKPCLDLDQISARMAVSRDPQELLDLWEGWHAIAPPMRENYVRFVTLSNGGARALGFADSGAMWRSGYDMPPDAFAAEVDRLWAQMKPLYASLHCYVRRKLQERYGEALVPPGKPIPAHLLGNMWAQSWTNIYDLVKPPTGDRGYDLTAELRKRKIDGKELVRYGERFFTSLGFAPLPASFWERSLFARPSDRDVVCHASAWNIDWKDDLRLKMCVNISEEDFVTVHHELGHNIYQRAYNRQPPLFADSAHDGFHEGIGDAVALSATPSYLVKVGLLDALPRGEGDLGYLLNMALEKVAFLPFGMVVDQWRWKVFSGEVPPSGYNEAWWKLREKIQGVAPPLPRDETDFDPGAKYHVPANTPYTRYFLAGILQFQFHRALCREAGVTGPLHACSVYGNRKAGDKLGKMLAMGRSRPWPDALEALSGERRMDATAMLDYFAPLQKWLDEQNRGQVCGW